KQLLLNTWVAHGQGSGDDMAKQFSDNNESHQSSLGFYLTDDVYMGKHGRSLRLDGLDEGFNRNARTRDIVVHAADYVGETAIEKMGRLGRSFGCPAVAPEVRDQVINTIKGKTVLFINGNDSNYSSKYLDESNLTAFVPDTTGFAITASLK
ncbi:MAG TPA: murein L,D-transpeptidase catalytic domain family protein, partial [Mucilaginibacter sp.]